MTHQFQGRKNRYIQQTFPFYVYSFLILIICGLISFSALIRGTEYSKGYYISVLFYLLLLLEIFINCWNLYPVFIASLLKIMLGYYRFNQLLSRGYAACSVSLCIFSQFNYTTPPNCLKPQAVQVHPKYHFTVDPLHCKFRVKKHIILAKELILRHKESDMWVNMQKWKVSPINILSQ